jgi:hypothetical protein
MPPIELTQLANEQKHICTLEYKHETHILITSFHVTPTKRSQYSYSMYTVLRTDAEFLVRTSQSPGLHPSEDFSRGWGMVGKYNKKVSHFVIEANPLHKGPDILSLSTY